MNVVRADAILSPPLSCARRLGMAQPGGDVVAVLLCTARDSNSECLWRSVFSPHKVNLSTSPLVLRNCKSGAYCTPLSTTSEETRKVCSDNAGATPGDLFSNLTPSHGHARGVTDAKFPPRHGHNAFPQLLMARDGRTGHIRPVSIVRGDCGLADE